jgi:anti-sigma B factor antagonist
MAASRPSVEADVSGWAIVRLHGEQDDLEAKRRRAALQDGVALGGGRLVVDLSGVTFGDSSLLGSLVSAVKTARRRGCTVRVVTADERMRRKFVVTGLDRVFRVFATVPEALEGSS